MVIKSIHQETIGSCKPCHRLYPQPGQSVCRPGRHKFDRGDSRYGNFRARSLVEGPQKTNRAGRIQPRWRVDRNHKWRRSGQDMGRKNRTVKNDFERTQWSSAVYFLQPGWPMAGMHRGPLERGAGGPLRLALPHDAHDHFRPGRCPTRLK